MKRKILILTLALILPLQSIAAAAAPPIPDRSLVAGAHQASIADTLANSGLPVDKQLEALRISVEMAYEIESNKQPNAAIGDGSFLKALLELITVLLPIILEILRNAP